MLPLILAALSLNAQPDELYSGKVEKIQSGFSFTEGPSADAEGNVYFTDQPNNKIHIWNYKTNEITLFHDSAERSNGTFFDKYWNLVACADLHGRIISIKKDGHYDVLFENYLGKQVNGPNDLWVAPDGGIYFTDPYYQRSYWERTEPDLDGERVYYLSPEGEVSIVDGDLIKPNGIIGTRDGKNLFVADIKDGKTYKYDINDDGSLSNKTLFAEEGSDGMTIDQLGNIYLSNEFVSVFDQDGNNIAKISVPEKPANLCFAGKERDILFITARTSVYKLEMNVKGVY